jgi:transcriptional regulator with XRE-family HTH domain
MLNITLIETAMRSQGLNGTSLAEACQVSKEATSNWLKGESVPRPTKLVKLAEALKVSVGELLAIQKRPEPLFAYRTKQNRAVTGEAREAALEMALHLQQLLPFVEDRSAFEPPLMREPSLEEDRIRHAAIAVRTSLRLSHTDALTNEALEGLFHTFGAFLVPVLWGLNKEKHENALTVYLPESKTSWVVFNLGCKQDDYKYWLAHEYGHCLTLHGLSEEDGEIFAERFAQHLVFPDEVAHGCLERMRSSNTNMMAIAQEFADRYGVSIVTVLKAVERLNVQLYGKELNLLTRSFWGRWNSGRDSVPSVAHQIFEKDTPAPAEYVAKVERRYNTPIFKALTAFQDATEGRDPAFVANALKIGIGEAVSLSHALWKRQS